MKAVTVGQPWATFAGLGYKRIETRSWRSDYRGPVAIHSSARSNLRDAGAHAARWAVERRGLTVPLQAGGLVAGRFPLGCVVAIAYMDGSRRTEDILHDGISDLERELGNYEPGRYGFLLRTVWPLPSPIPAKGRLSLWEWPEGDAIDFRRLTPAPLVNLGG